MASLYDGGASTTQRMCDMLDVFSDPEHLESQLNYPFYGLTSNNQTHNSYSCPGLTTRT